MMKKAATILGSVILITAFTFRKEKVFIPPGTVQINDTLFADETEVSNFSWREFEVFHERKYGKGSPEHLACLPDTMVWRSSMTYNQPYVDYYYRHPAFKDYPVVGVSYEQALAYCTWRTEMAHVFLEIKEGKRKVEERNKPYTGELKFEYNLPTKQEWQALALVGEDLRKKEKYTKKSSVFHNALDTTDILNDNASVTTPVYSYMPNKLGLYNLLGNVSEMLLDKGIAKGGSWRTYSDKLSIWTDEKFENANAVTGFRCVCVMKK